MTTFRRWIACAILAVCFTNDSHAQETSRPPGTAPTTGPTTRRAVSQPDDHLKVPVSSIARRLAWVGGAAQEKDYTLWCPSPIFGPDGKVHLFVARWPEKNVDPAWRKSSEIAHYIADQPEGPFAFVDVALTGTGQATWDKWSAHNPEVFKDGDRYALLYISNSDFHQPPHPLNQRIGMALSDSLNGPWKRSGKDGMLLGPSSDPRHFTFGRQIVNPTLVKFHNQYLLYFKTARQGGGTVYGLATAENLEGPYTMLDQPIATSGGTMEDGSAFEWQNKICLLTTDNHGNATGIFGGGTLWVSDDGVHFNPEWTQLGFYRIPTYFKDYDPAKATCYYGQKVPKFERPKILMKDGQPAYLYATSGVNVFGGPRTIQYVLKLNLQPGDGPLPRPQAP